MDIQLGGIFVAPDGMRWRSRVASMGIRGQESRQVIRGLESRPCPSYISTRTLAQPSS